MNAAANIEEMLMRENRQRLACLKARSSSSKPLSDEWYTPGYITDALGDFDLDPCAGPRSIATWNVCRPADGLAVDWENHRVWLNPPYSRLQPWLKRLMHHGNGIAMVPSRVETVWFQEAAAAADGMLMLRNRVQFERPDQPPCRIPVASILLAYGVANARLLKQSGLRGIYSKPKEIRHGS